MPIRSHLTARRFCHRGRALPLSAAARPSNLTGAGSRRISDHSSGNRFISEQPWRGILMSLTDHAASSHSTKKEHRRGSRPSSNPSKARPQQPRMVRLTVSLPGDLVDRLRDAVYWSPSLTLAWLIAQSLRTSLAEMESVRQGPFPKRTNALRAGRPRLVGQTMNVPPRTRLTSNETAYPVEGVTRAIPGSHP